MRQRERGGSIRGLLHLVQQKVKQYGQEEKGREQEVAVGFIIFHYCIFSAFPKANLRVG